MPGLNYDFSQFKEVVEFVNEGQSLAADLLKTNPGLKGVLFGRAEDIETIRNSLDEGIRQRCEFIKGDLFSSILPAGYPLYLLRNIIDSLEENQAISFLYRCYQATETYARFLLIESNKDNPPDEVAKYHKIKERYQNIFKQANFILTNVINSGGDTDIIEVLRK